MQDACAQLNIQIREQQEQAKIYESDQMAKTNKNIAIYENNQRMIVDAKIKAEADERQKAAELAFAQAMADMAQSSEAASARIEQMNEQIKTLQKEIADYSAKQTAINEAIMRQRALDEQKDFYRICIDEDYKSDIDFLLNAKKNLKKTEIIDKIIYDNYISKPVLEMIKRVLQNESFSGIYKITNLLTNEIYIGKSTDIKARWTNHAKTTFNCGTIASSILHINMRKYGIENFSFEVIEKVPKEQLSAREKFYIDFYKTKEFGLNERKGG